MKHIFNPLKDIKPNKNKKEAFRNFLIHKLGNNKEIYSQGAAFGFLGKFSKMTAVILVSVLALSGVSGAAFASQNSLPGDVLYPVKILTEKTQVALTKDEINKASLHLEFAQKRLDELKKLSENNNVSYETVTSVVSSYNGELEKSSTALQNTKEDKLLNIAEKINSQAEKNKGSIENISKKLDPISKFALEDAKEKTEKANDNAVLTLFAISERRHKEDRKDNERDNEGVLQNTTSTTTEEDVIDTNNVPIATTTSNTIATSTNEIENKNFENKNEDRYGSLSHGLLESTKNKINSVEKKIKEVKKYLSQKENRYDVSDANAILENAKIILEDSQNLLSLGNYKEAFEKAMEADKKAQEAKMEGQNGSVNLQDGNDRYNISKEGKENKSDNNDTKRIEERQIQFTIPEVTSETSTTTEEKNITATTTDVSIKNNYENENKEDEGFFQGIFNKIFKRGEDTKSYEVKDQNYYNERESENDNKDYERRR